MPAAATAAVGVAFALDALVGEPPGRVHPVALFGRVVAPLDRAWDRPDAVGVAVAALLPLAAAGVAWGVVALAVGVVDALLPASAGGALRSPAAAVVAAAVAGVALFTATSLRMLLSAARGVIGDSGGDADRAREGALALVGRDASTLSPGELRSAAVESAAENLADGLVAPLSAFALGATVSVPAAVAAAAWVKAVNTLDSMLGYRSKPVGRASARLDDAVMWLPARLSALLLAAAGGSPSSLLGARAWARVPDSPNSGWPMATLAAVLGAELRKPGSYVLNPGAGLPAVADAERGVRVVSAAGGVAFLLAGVAAWP